MGTSSKVFVSPGVYTSERELSFVAQSVGVTTLGIVGETLKGPAFEPIFITNYDEFRTYFGDTKSERFVNTQIPKYEAAYIAKSYLQQSNQLFVTRILGLSGFDAGPSWSIKSIANVDSATVALVTPNLGGALSVTANTYSSFTESSIIVSGLDTLPFSGDWATVFTDNNGNNVSLSGSIVNFITEIITASGLNTSDIYYYGSLDNSDVTFLSAYTSTTNVFGVDNIDLSLTELTASTNNTWYYTLFDSTDCNYVGYSFAATFDTYSTATPGIITMNVNIRYNELSGTCLCDYNDLVLATFRSRGLSIDQGPTYEVSATTNLVMNCSGDYSQVTSNPYATFGVSGLTISGVSFEFEVSLDENNQNYITKVLGKGNFDKLKSEVPIFVEESYPVLLYNLYMNSKIKGLSCDLISLDSARSGNQYSHGWWLDKFQTPETPWVVSELRGNVVYKLFKFISISDGNAANTEIKVSIANLSYVDGTFDILVRDFYDTDRNPVVIEKFEGCTMNPGLNNYVAKKIGSSNGEYASLSRYIMLEVNEFAPVDTLPCGFEGYIVPTYSGYTACPTTGNKPPFPIYKTKVNYPGEVIYTPPFGDPVLSLGDKPKRTYLGFTSIVGVDSDLLQYKGKQNNDLCTETNDLVWNYQTRGFHMDSGATVITIADQYVTSGQQAFDCGAGDFSSDPSDPNNPYYYLYARKFSLVFQGGFDGWDIYRQWRTNTDEYQIGKPSYLKGSCPTIRFPQATGWGAFKTINNDGDITNYANTDYYAYLIGMQTFNNPTSVNINVLATPGIDMFNNLELVKSAIDMVEQERADSIYIVTMPDWEMYTPTNQNPFDYIYPEDAVDRLEDTDIDSNYTATYFPWVLTRDNVNLTQIYIPPTAEVTRNLALTDNIAFPWFATAGYTRGLVNSVKARKKMSQEDRDILYKGRINPIATFQDVGTVIWGNKTLQISEGALNRINVRRLLLQARKLISAVAVRLLFEQNDEKLRQDFLDAVNPILDAIRRDRGLVDFRVTVSNSPEDFDKQQLSGKVYLKPTKALEFIDIEFLITPLGASFEDI